MIIVDTNVVSELIADNPNAAVLNWVGRMVPTELTLTATVCAELLFGAGILPVGKRRAALEARVGAAIAGPFAERVVPFDLRAAEAYAHVRSVRRRSGRPMSMGDAQIAAVCLVHEATLATRNVRDFEGCGIRLVNPWGQ
ncbi:type II toxin-antitoxin system VapC family toxin [Rathayibacter soli]|uniref:type II toxin-antitoxin system VapC family toxin n=1 Tax=Rathayibacter soli TaxID=3144168 RepID=UPI0027E40A98|nr:type II toxin-antitoxin system VapC family toxin [Glaciibacter superstes]